MLNDEEVKQVVEELGKSIANGDKYGIVPALFNYMQSINSVYTLDEQPKDIEKYREIYDIYSEDLKTEAMNILKEWHVLFIQGNSGMGKTSFSHYLASQLTGYTLSTSASDLNLERVCIHKATDGFAVYTKDLIQKGILNKYIDYIKANNITEPCVFICDETQTYGLSALFGDLYTGFLNRDYLLTNIPKNLYIICTGLLGQSLFTSGDAKAIKIEGLTVSNKYLHNMLVKKFGDMHSNLDYILLLSERINGMCTSLPIISVRSIVYALRNNHLRIKHYKPSNFVSLDAIYKALQELQSVSGFIIVDAETDEPLV